MISREINISHSNESFGVRATRGVKEKGVGKDILSLTQSSGFYYVLNNAIRPAGQIPYTNSVPFKMLPLSGNQKLSRLLFKSSEISRIIHNGVSDQKFLTPAIVSGKLNLLTARYLTEKDSNDKMAMPLGSAQKDSAIAEKNRIRNNSRAFVEERPIKAVLRKIPDSNQSVEIPRHKTLSNDSISLKGSASQKEPLATKDTPAQHSDIYGKYLAQKALSNDSISSKGSPSQKEPLPVKDMPAQHFRISGKYSAQNPFSAESTSLIGKHSVEHSAQFATNSSFTRLAIKNTEAPRPALVTIPSQADWTRYAVFEKHQILKEKGLGIRNFNEHIAIKLSDDENMLPSKRVQNTSRFKSPDDRIISEINARKHASDDSNVTKVSDSKRTQIQASQLTHLLKDHHSAKGLRPNSETWALVSTESVTVQKRERVGDNLQNNEASAPRATDVKYSGGKDTTTAKSESQLISANPVELKLVKAKGGLIRIIPTEVSRAIIDIANANQTFAGKVFNIKLHPPELGFINLKLTEINNAINVKMTVESEAVLKTIQDNNEEIKNILLASGINMDRLDIRLDDKLSDSEYRKFKDQENSLDSGYSHRGSDKSNRHQPESNLKSVSMALDSKPGGNYFVSGYGINWLA